MDISGLIGLLIWIIILGIVFYVAWWALGRIGLPEPFNKVATVVLVLICLLVLLSLFTGVVSLPKFR